MEKITPPFISDLAGVSNENSRMVTAIRLLFTMTPSL